MGKVLVTESYLTAIGDAIRSKAETTNTYKPSEMADAIKNIKSSVTYTTGDLKVVSPDSWTLKITQTPHQTITATPKSELIKNADGSYSTAMDADFTISSYTGYVPGTVQKSADKSTQTYNVTASEAEEIAGMVQDGWAKVYEDGSGFYSDENYSTKFSSLSGDILVAGMKDSDTSSLDFVNSLFANNGNLIKAKNSFITKAGKYYLYSCASLESVYLPNLVSSGYYLLASCGALKELCLPNLTAAGDYFLSGCEDLEEIDLPKVTSIGNSFLYGNKTLKSLYLRSTTMCSLGPNSYIPANDMSIYVPAALIDSYKTAAYWSSYASKFKTLESIELSKISIEGSSNINMYGGNTTGKYTIKYNDGASLPDQRGITWSITGNATISSDGTVTLNNASAGDTLTITATSTYNSSISASKTVTVINIVATISIDLNNGQWVDSGTKVDGHTVYKSDAGSYHVNSGTSTCTVTVQGYSKVTVYLRSYGENNYDYAEVGPLDGTVSRASSSNVLSCKGKASGTQYQSYTFTISDTNEHTFQVLYSKDSSSDSYDDRGYFYVVPE